MVSEKTTIEVKIPTYQMLNSRKRPGDSFDDVIGRMNEELEQAEQRVDELEQRLEEQPDVDDGRDRDGADVQGEPVDDDCRDDVATALDRDDEPALKEPVDDGAAESHEEAVEAIIDELDLPGGGHALASRRDAVRACWRYLREQGEATKSDFVDDVYPDHRASYGSSGGWWNTVGKQGLRTVADEHDSVDAPIEGNHVWFFVK
jgi:predicted CopG family antitoxin